MTLSIEREVLVADLIETEVTKRSLRRLWQTVKMLDLSGIGYLAISEAYRGSTLEQFQKVCISFTAGSGAWNASITDLRGNPASPQTAVQDTSAPDPAGRDRPSQHRDVPETKSIPGDAIPRSRSHSVVLVNENTASAAEI